MINIRITGKDDYVRTVPAQSLDLVSGSGQEIRLAVLLNMFTAVRHFPFVLEVPEGQGAHRATVLPR